MIEHNNSNNTIIKTSNKNDIWFHLDKISGPHFVLQNNGDTIPKRYLNNIANMFPNFKSNLSNRYTVIYTEIKNVKLTTTPGQVNVSKTKTIKI